MSDLPPASRPLVQALIEKRLLLSDLRDGEQVEWPMKAYCANGTRWRNGYKESEDLKEADRLEQAAAAWTKSGTKADWLMEGERLIGAETLAAKPTYRRRLAQPSFSLRSNTP